MEGSDPRIQLSKCLMKALTIKAGKGTEDGCLRVDLLDSRALTSCCLSSLSVPV